MYTNDCPYRLKNFLFMSYLDTDMLPARQVPSREVPVSSVINKTQETDTTGTQTNDQPNNPTGWVHSAYVFGQFPGAYWKSLWHNLQN